MNAKLTASLVSAGFVVAGAMIGSAISQLTLMHRIDKAEKAERLTADEQKKMKGLPVEEAVVAAKRQVRTILVQGERWMAVFALKRKRRQQALESLAQYKREDYGFDDEPAKTDNKENKK